MQTLIKAILTTLLMASVSWAETTTVIVGQPTVVSAATPTRHFKFDAAGGTGNTQIYDEISGTWVGAGADTVTFATDGGRTVIQSNSTTDRVYVPGSYIQYSDNVTVEVTYKASTTTANLLAVYYNVSGDIFSIYPYQSGGNARVSVTCNSLAAYVAFTEPTVNNYHTIRALVDYVNDTITVYVDGSAVSTTPSNLSNLADMGTLSGNLYFGYETTGTDTISIDEVKIWHGLVAP